MVRAVSHRPDSFNIGETRGFIKGEKCGSPARGGNISLIHPVALTSSLSDAAAAAADDDDDDALNATCAIFLR